MPSSTGWSIRTRKTVRITIPRIPRPGGAALRRNRRTWSIFLGAWCVGIAVSGQAARGETVAVLQGLDKTTARISTIEAPLDRSVRFGGLVITARACVKRPPEEPPETAAFLEIDEIRPGGTSVTTARVFSGWMFKSSPALSALENPVYDVGVLDCKAASGSPPDAKGSARPK
jgi:hypothetical protein